MTLLITTMIPPVRRLVLLAVLLAALALPAVAHAHATFIRSNPRDGAALSESPRKVVVVFDDGVEVGKGNAVVDDNGKSVLDGRPRTKGKVLTLPVHAQLGRGDYSARWSVVSDDGHQIQGVLAFSVGTGRPPSAPVLSAAGSLTFANVLSRFLAFAGLLAAVGIAVFDLFFWRPFARRALPTGALTIASALVFLGAHGLTHVSHAEGWNRFSVVWQAGGVWAAVGATLAAIGLADPRVRPVASPFALPLVVVPTLAGHALDPGRSWVDVPIDLLHVAAAAVWFGGLTALVFAVPKGTGVIATSAARRFSKVALVSVIVVGATGFGRALAELSKVSQLWTTGYGRALVVKTVLLGVLMVLGWFSRSALRIGFERLRLPVRAELAPALGIALAVAFLTALPPGRNAARAKAVAREPRLPGPTAIVAGAQDDTRNVLLGVDKGRASVIFYGQDGAPTNVTDVRIAGKKTSSCGKGCYTARVGNPQSLTVTHGNRTLAFDLEDLGNGTQLVKGVSKVVKSLRGFSFVERLSSGTVTIVTNWQEAPPNKLRYRINTGAESVIIGSRRWDRQPGGKWVESAQTPLSLPAPAWYPNRFTNARIVTRKGNTVVVTFLDAQGGPAWFRLTADKRTLRPIALRMYAPAHFMHHRYFGLGKPVRIVPPTG
jgi:copper transport protein